MRGVMMSVQPLFRVADCEPSPPVPQPVPDLTGDLGSLSDAELLDVAAAARRQTSWAQARELAAIAELTRRRTADEEKEEPDVRVLSAHESVIEEVGATLTVTGNAAATLVDLAERLHTVLPGTRRALEAGRIDLARARVIADACQSLPGHLAARIEAAILDEAPIRTTGQLRRRLKALTRRLAPEESDERARATVKNRRLELWETPAGTAALALTDIAPEDAHAAHNKISAAAHGIKASGDPRTLHQLRADLATRLLQGATLPDAVRATFDAAPSIDSSTPILPAGLEAPSAEERPAPHTAQPVMPRVLAAVSLEGAAGAEQTQDTDGHRHLSAVPPPNDAAPHEALRQQVAEAVQRCLTHVHRQARATGTLDRLPAAIGETVQRLHHEFAEPRATACRDGLDQHGQPGYRPSTALRREIAERHPTCVFPTCNQPAHRCDVDHTVPWPTGATCRCNLAPLCRRHHRTKQSRGWRLAQVWPGLLVWITPSGTWHITRPSRE
ncbi:DUF222 domain-containing protein [Actinomadura geliboluensis]|uniref:HNH endonuclease signature motif containing protein n=1 Tax=Actinomadura geliboluensis TaxID=882440 RepID=UPI00370FE3EC